MDLAKDLYELAALKVLDLEHNDLCFLEGMELDGDPHAHGVDILEGCCKGHLLEVAPQADNDRLQEESVTELGNHDDRLDDHEYL